MGTKTPSNWWGTARFQSDSPRDCQPPSGAKGTWCQTLSKVASAMGDHALQEKRGKDGSKPFWEGWSL